MWLVLFFDNIPKDTNHSICSSINSLSGSLNGNGLTKKDDSSITCMSAVRFGHAPLKLNASQYLSINFISLAFSLDVRYDSDKSIFSYKI